eukprot:3456742-Prymnesium_polylepis.1
MSGHCRHARRAALTRCEEKGGGTRPIGGKQSAAECLCGAHRGRGTCVRSDGSSMRCSAKGSFQRTLPYSERTVEEASSTAPTCSCMITCVLSSTVRSHSCDACSRSKRSTYSSFFGSEHGPIGFTLGASLLGTSSTEKAMRSRPL